MNTQPISGWALACVADAITAVIVLILAGYGYQWGWYGLGTAFSVLLPVSGVLGILAVILAVVFGYIRWQDPAVMGAPIAFVGLFLGLGVIGTLGYWANEAGKYPPIHDISTDTRNPPEFRNIVPLRAGASNDTTYGDREKVAIQREHYPDLQTLHLEMNFSDAYDHALQAARRMPWEQIVTEDREAGLIEAVDKLPWFGFIDDVVIRVDTAETADSSRIDVRSVSRIGRGDLGVNAHRIREYLETLQAALPTQR